MHLDLSKELYALYSSSNIACSTDSLKAATCCSRLTLKGGGPCTATLL